MSLAFDYSEELANALDVIAVYLPGDPVSVGDIISFDYSNFWGTVKPYGSFNHVTSLNDLHINTTSQSATVSNPYLYASSKKVSFSFNAGAATNAQATQGSGTLNISFNSEGSIFLSALGCKKSYLKDITNLKDSLAPFKTKIDWKHCFIVTAVTVADKAIVMQSSSSGASLTLQGDVKQLQPGGSSSVNLNANVSIVSSSNAAFLKDWSDDVNVFMDLVQFEQSSFDSLALDSRTLRGRNLYVNDSDEFVLRSVKPRDYLSKK